MWGYLSETATPRLSTLNILSQFIGYNNWDAFCKSESTEEPVEENEEINESVGQESERQTHDSHRWHPKWIIMTLIAVIALATFTWASLHYSSQPSTAYVLKQGDHFPTCMDYLKLFGISDSAKYWGRVLPHHPNIVVWGPEYHHPHWHNYGNKDSMMPTITEHWEPADADSLMVAMRNRDKYDHERRLNEVRITFMKNLVDTGYVFIGIYRLSLQQSDTINCVWERVADECDLNSLDYLDELRN